MDPGYTPDPDDFDKILAMSTQKIPKLKKADGSPVTMADKLNEYMDPNANAAGLRLMQGKAPDEALDPIDARQLMAMHMALHERTGAMDFELAGKILNTPGGPRMQFHLHQAMVTAY